MLIPHVKPGHFTFEAFKQYVVLFTASYYLERNLNWRTFISLISLRGTVDLWHYTMPIE